MGEPMYIETWQVTGNPKGDLLEIAYIDSVYLTDEAIDGLRRYMAAAHGCTLVKLLRVREIEFEEEQYEGNKADHPQNQNKTDM